MIDGLPPQLSQGEYENLVKNFLRESISLSDYARTLKRELFEISVLELKGDLVEKLSYLLINEPTERYLEIMGHNPPYKEKYITKECLEFVDDFLSRLDISEPRSTFARGVLDFSLRVWLRDLQEGGHHSPFFEDFPRYFCGH